MNRLRGKIESVETSGSLSLVDVSVNGQIFTAILLETPATAPYLKQGGHVWVMFKETEVSLARELTGRISLRNRMPALVSAIKEGELLSEITLDYQGNSIVSVITTRSVRRLELNPGDAVEGLVKANEVTLMECLDEL